MEMMECLLKRICCCFKENSQTNDDPESKQNENEKLLSGKPVVKSPLLTHLARNEYLDLPGRGERHFIAQHFFKPATQKDLEIKPGDKLEIVKDYEDYYWCSAKNVTTNKVGLVLKEFIKSNDSIESELWYFPHTSLLNAEELLLENTEEGTFLVGPIKLEYFLSIRCNSRNNKPIVKHYHIYKDNMGFYLNPKYICHTLKELIQMLQEDRTNFFNLCCLIKNPCLKEPPQFSELSGLFKSSWEMNRNELKKLNEIGSGQFSIVYKGDWMNKPIVIKEIRRNDVAEKDFKKEVEIMKKLKNPNIISIYGTCTETTPLLLIMEYVQGSSLKEYILNHNLEPYDKINIAAQIALGMAYLASKNIIHRDLAARNILLNGKLSAKIADFGLSRLLRDASVYNPREDALLPLKWYGVECLITDGAHSIQSDVWSFGILVMEIYTNGTIPYKNMPNWCNKVVGGFRMAKPKEMPTEIYALLLKCWETKPEIRPRFKSIHADLLEMYWSIDRSKIKKAKAIASGNFGDVFLGKFNDKDVAIKEIKNSDIAIQDFVKEVEVMKQLVHENIVIVYGSSSDERPYCIIMEYMINGSLSSYIKRDDVILDLDDSMKICKQVANGMQYLEEANIIHRDLAARNILVGENLLCKIADFGLSRLLREASEYEISGTAAIAARWYPPMCTDKGIFTVKSDVWAFGILTMEIFMKGARPYSDVDPNTWKVCVNNGYRMMRPDHMPDSIYDVLLKCWEEDEADRPTFKMLFFEFCSKKPPLSVSE